MSEDINDYMKDEDEYGGDFKNHLLEQYLSYVESSKRVTRDRIKTNKFFVTLLSSLAVFMSIAKSLPGTENVPQIGLFLTSLLGLSFSILWWANVKSYRQINSGKYEVIDDFEKELPFEAYRREWDVLDNGESWKTYLEHTTVEKAITYPLIVVFLIFSILNFPLEGLQILVSLILNF